MDSKGNPGNGNMDFVGFFKKHLETLKGLLSLFIGSYLVFLKYQIIVDFGLFFVGVIAIFYGISLLGLGNLQSFFFRITRFGR